MNGFYEVHIESFPSYPTSYLIFDPVEATDTSSYFTMEIPRDEIALTKVLRKLQVWKDLETPMDKVRAFAREALTNNLHSCYCPGDNIRDIIDLYQNSESSPEKDFPGAEEGEKSDTYHDLYPGVPQAFITENIPLIKDTMIKGVLYEAGSTLKVYYKGSIE